MRRPFDFGLLGVFLLVAFISGIAGYVMGWDHECTKDLPTRTDTRGIDRERSTARAGAAIVSRQTTWHIGTPEPCIAEEGWRDGLTVACGRATR
jgi:hypothetical protein